MSLPVPLAVLAGGALNAQQQPKAPAGRFSGPKIKAFLIAQHLPIGLFLFTIGGFLVPEPGKALEATPLNTISIVGIFFISGLGLQTEEVTAALKAVPSYVFGFISILGITPCLAFLIAKFDLGPAEFAKGLALFAAMPTTVSSGMVMTAEAGGNTALSVLLSVGTNILGIVTCPFFLAGFLTANGAADASASNIGVNGTSTAASSAGSATDTSRAFDPIDMLWKLSLSILLPLIIGKSLRYFKRVVAFVKANKLRLKLLSSALLISVPWMSISAASDTIKQSGGNHIAALVFLGITLHAVLLAFNYGSCVLMDRIGIKIPLAERKAVVINSSQKTVNTAVSVISFLPAAVADRGMITVPCIIAHFAQIIMDAFVVSYWKKFKDEKPTAPAAATTAAAAGVVSSPSGDSSNGGSSGQNDEWAASPGSGLASADSVPAIDDSAVVIADVPVR